MLLKKLHIIVVAYGEWHLNLFEKILIPNLCGLLAEIPEELRKQTRLRIFTREESAEQIRVVLDRIGLSKFLSCEVLPEVSPPTSHNPYPEMNRMHQIALRDAGAEDAGLFFMFPDQVLSQGTLRTILNAVEKGFRLVTFPSIRIKLEPLLPLLAEKILNHPRQFLYEKPRSLVKTILPYLHQLLTDMFWESYDKEEACAGHYAVMWNVREKGIMARGFHNYVAFAWPAVRRSDYSHSIDVHFIKESVENFDQICMVADSDQAFAFDLSNEERTHHAKVEAKSRAERFLKVADNSYLFTDYHLRTALTICRIHSGDIDETWLREERKFDRATTYILIYILIRRFLKNKLHSGIHGLKQFFFGENASKQIQKALRLSQQGSPDLAASLLTHLILSRQKTSRAASELSNILRSGLRDRCMADRFISELGWNPNDFKGFSHLDPSFLRQLEWQSVSEKISYFTEKAHASDLTQMIFAEDCATLNDSTALLQKDFGNHSAHKAARFYLQGLNFLKENKPDEALSRFAAVNVLEPACRQAYLQRAQIHLNKSQYRSALNMFNRSSEVNDKGWHQCAQRPKKYFLPKFLAKTKQNDRFYYFFGNIVECRSPLWRPLWHIEEWSIKTYFKFNHTYKHVSQMIRKLPSHCGKFFFNTACQIQERFLSLKIKLMGKISSAVHQLVHKTLLKKFTRIIQELKESFQRILPAARIALIFANPLGFLLAKKLQAGTPDSKNSSQSQHL